MSGELPKIELARRETVATEIAHRLLEHLLSGKVKPGSRLPPERKLAEDLGVGRSTVRDALKSLALLGVIEVRQGDGSYFQNVPSNLLPRSVEWGLLVGEPHTLDLVEARGFIEIAVVRLAAERRTEAHLQTLEALIKRMKEARKDPEGFVKADLEFHMTLADAAANTSLREILSGMRTLLDVWIRRVIEAAGDADYSYRRHKKIFEAVRSGDPEAAEVAMREHMTSAGIRLRKTLEEYQVRETPNSG